MALRHTLAASGALAAFLAAAGCHRTPPANVAASINGHAITYAEVDKQLKWQFPNQPEASSADQVQFQKLTVLRALIDEEMLLQRAERLGLIATEAEVDTKFNEIRAPYTQEEFQKQLNDRGMTVDELKSKLRRDLSTEKLLNKEVFSRINISDKDISDFYNANKAAFKYPENNYRVAKIAVTPQPAQDVQNLKRDKAQNEDQARKKIQMIEARLKQGDDFAALAQNFSEDPQTAGNGGDMGFIPESLLAKAEPEIRKIVLALPVGQFSAPARTGGVWLILKMIQREEAGQRDLNDPRVQQSIREELRTRKEQLLRGAYMEACRNEAQVSNYLAITLAPSFEQK
jgi:peptidyl-prolyl cis-trans isomerase SurA